MIFKILISYIIGYLNIEVEGAFVERFINICKSKNIGLWNIKMEKGIKIYANIGIKDFKNLKGISKKTNTKIKIVQKRGIPFLIDRYKKRKIFAIVIVLICSLLFIVSNFIWNINISGNKEIRTEELKELLEKNGVKIGSYKHSLDINSIVNKIRLERDDIAWIGIKIVGTNVKVEVREMVKAPKIINEEEYCNIIANKEGMITKINVQNGTTKLREGDIVKSGDILVYGYLEGKYTGTRYVHAMANIEAKVWYSKKEKVFLSQEIPRETGNKETKYSINFNNFKINFYKTLSKFEKYDTIVKSKKLKLFSDFYLPVEIIKTINKEYLLESVLYTEEELTRNDSQENRRRIKKTNSRQNKNS